MPQHAILFTGTRFMDGLYSEVALAYKCAESLRERFPHLQVDLIQVSEGFQLSDDIFWVNHLEELQALNWEGDGRTARTLADIAVEGRNPSYH